MYFPLCNYFLRHLYYSILKAKMYKCDYFILNYKHTCVLNIFLSCLKLIKRIEYVIMQIFYRSDDFPYIIPYIPLQYSHLL